MCGPGTLGVRLILHGAAWSRRSSTGCTRSAGTAANFFGRRARCTGPDVERLALLADAASEMPDGLPSGLVPILGVASGLVLYAASSTWSGRLDFKGFCVLLSASPSHLGARPPPAEILEQGGVPGYIDDNLGLAARRSRRGTGIRSSDTWTSQSPKDVVRPSSCCFDPPATRKIGGVDRVQVLDLELVGPHSSSLRMTSAHVRQLRVGSRRPSAAGVSGTTARGTPGGPVSPSFASVANRSIWGEDPVRVAEHPADVADGDLELPVPGWRFRLRLTEVYGGRACLSGVDLHLGPSLGLVRAGLFFLACGSLRRGAG